MSITASLSLTIHRNPAFPRRIEKVECHFEGEGLAPLNDETLYFFGYAPNYLYSLRAGDVVTLGALRLRIIADTTFRETFCYDACFVMPDSAQAWFRRFTFPVISYWWVFNTRLLLTFAVWGLAERFPGHSMAWKDVYAVRRCAKAIASARRFAQKHLSFLER